jgi:hypothetical protein
MRARARLRARRSAARSETPPNGSTGTAQARPRGAPSGAERDVPYTVRLVQIAGVEAVRRSAPSEARAGYPTGERIAATPSASERTISPAGLRPAMLSTDRPPRAARPRCPGRSSQGANRPSSESSRDARPPHGQPADGPALARTSARSKGSPKPHARARAPRAREGGPSAPAPLHTGLPRDCGSGARCPRSRASRARR